MAIIAALTMAGALAIKAASPACPGDTTIEINACLSDEARRADAVQGRYLAAAEARLKREAKDDKAAGTALADLQKAQAAWIQYRNLDCGATYDWWAEGTIRGAKLETCWIDLTLLHTHWLWREWLTYEDSTPPILPEPPLPRAD